MSIVTTTELSTRFAKRVEAGSPEEMANSITSIVAAEITEALMKTGTGSTYAMAITGESTLLESSDFSATFRIWRLSADEPTSEPDPDGRPPKPTPEQEQRIRDRHPNMTYPRAGDILLHKSAALETAALGEDPR